MSRLTRDGVGRGLARKALLLWGGIAVGVAFIATPAKFLAPSLSLPVALDVGRQTFRVFNTVEIGLVVILSILAFLSKHRREEFLRFSLPALIVALQAIWLIPALDARVAMIMAGSSPPPSALHTIYIGLELAKIVWLLVAGFMPLRASAGVR